MCGVKYTSVAAILFHSNYQVSSSPLVIWLYVSIVHVCDCYMGSIVVWLYVGLVVLGLILLVLSSLGEPPCTLGSGLNPDVGDAWLVP